MLLLLWWLPFYGILVLETKASESKTANPNIAYFSGNAFAIYEPWNISGKMTFVFKTHKQSGMLFYQDDGNYAYMNLQMKAEGLQMEITLGSCRQREFLLQGEFADSEWHRVLLEGSPQVFNLTVDGRFFKTVKCMQETPFNPVRRLYVRSFPRSLELVDSLVSSIAFYRDYYGSERRFIGCLGRFQYSDTIGILHDVEMRESSGIIRVCDTGQCPTQNYCQETGLKNTSNFSAGAQLHAEAKPVMKKVSSSLLISPLSDLVTMTTSPSVVPAVTTKLTLTAVTMVTLNATHFGASSSDTIPEKSSGIGGTSPMRMEPTIRLTQVYNTINLSPVQSLYEAFQTRSPAPNGLAFSKIANPPFVSHSDRRPLLTSQVGYSGGEHTAETVRFSKISSVSPHKVVRSLQSPTLTRAPGTIDYGKEVLAQRNRSSGRVVSIRVYGLVFYVALIMCT